MPKLSFSIVFLVCLLSTQISFAKVEKRLTCVPAAQVYKSAWGMKNHEYMKMVENAELAEHQDIPQAVKIDQIHSAMEHYRRAPSKAMSNDRLAHLVEEVASCTGNDYAFFAGVLGIESDFCEDKHNDGSGASGCGQFTGAAFKFFKRHLMLPGRDTDGTELIGKGMRTLIAQCYEREEDERERFLEVFSKSNGDIRRWFRRGTTPEDYKMDLVAAGIFLKFYYAKAGHYYDANKQGVGAIQRYGTSNGYSRKVASMTDSIKEVCFNDEAYVEEIEKRTCEMSGSPFMCNLLNPIKDL